MTYSRRNLIRLLISSFFIFCGLSFFSKVVASDDKIIASFNNYGNAILNADADTAYELIDSNTKKYYKGGAVS